MLRVIVLRDLAVVFWLKPTATDIYNPLGDLPQLHSERHPSFGPVPLEAPIQGISHALLRISALVPFSQQVFFGNHLEGAAFKF
jgi:hypothetical protein